MRLCHTYNEIIGETLADYFHMTLVLHVNFQNCCSVQEQVLNSVVRIGKVRVRAKHVTKN